jgi:hypothetical protein
MGAQNDAYAEAQDGVRTPGQRSSKMSSIEHMLGTPLHRSHNRYALVLVQPTDEKILAGGNEASLVTKTIGGMRIHQCASNEEEHTPYWACARSRVVGKMLIVWEGQRYLHQVHRGTRWLQGRASAVGATVR